MTFSTVLRDMENSHTAHAEIWRRTCVSPHVLTLPEFV